MRFICYLRHSAQLVPIRAVFNWVSTVIRNCIGFALLRPVIGPRNPRHLRDQSDAKLKSVTTWSHAFFRSLGSSVVSSLSSHLAFEGFFSFPLISCCEYFGYGFGWTTLAWSTSYGNSDAKQTDSRWDTVKYVKGGKVSKTHLFPKLPRLGCSMNKQKKFPPNKITERKTV